MNQVCVCIPVRYASTRLPGKPLLPIAGKPMIIRTFEQALKSKYVSLSNLFVFTDEIKIKDVILSYYPSANIVITSGEINGSIVEIPNALYRLSYYQDQLPDHFQAVISLHGDEPFLDPQMIDTLFEKFSFYQNQNTDKNTNKNSDQNTINQITGNLPSVLFYRQITPSEAPNRSFVKIVKNSRDEVMLLSRAMIPHNKSGIPDPMASYFACIGLILVSRSGLIKYKDPILNVTKPLYVTEDVEELKLLELGEVIKCLMSPVQETERSLNTEEDYRYFIAKYGE